jgi:tetratricopeptide (TPR) repeat protein
VGEAAFREGRYDEAALAFSRAVDRDSTFALAALMAARAGDKVGPGTIVGDFAARAWRHRDRLGPRERTYLEVYGASGFLGPSSPSHLLESIQRLVVLLPNDPDAWVMLGERIPHSMARAGASDSVTLRHAAEAYRKALALDSTHMQALTLLQLTEGALGDTAAAFRLARQYIARVPDGLEAENLRCVLAGASGAGALRSTTLEPFGPRALGRCLSLLHGMYSYAHEARDTVAAYLDRRSRSPEVIALAGPMMYTVALDRGRPREAKRHADAFRQAGLAWWSYHVSSAIRDALYSDRAEADASVAAAEIEGRLARGDPDLPEDQRVEALCALGQWRMGNGDATAATARARQLRLLAGEGETGPEVAALNCAALLEAWVAFVDTAPDLDARVDELEGMLIDGARNARLIRESAFLLARIREAEGQPARALEAIDRARFTRPHYYESTYLRERGRLAAILGDTVGAITPYRLYLAMRSNPEPALREEVERVRIELEPLGG